MNIIEKRNKIKQETQSRVKEIKSLIKYAFGLYVNYKSKGNCATKQDYINVVDAINKFYNDGSEYVQVGNLLYDFLPVSMYASMKNHKNAICRNAIKEMDRELEKQGIVVQELLDFKEKEESKFQQKEESLSL